MARGDQRERDRAKKQARLAKDAKGVAKEGNPEQRNLADSAALAVVVKSKAKKKEPAGLDDLLSAGLAGGRKKR